MISGMISGMFSGLMVLNTEARHREPGEIRIWQRGHQLLAGKVMRIRCQSGMGCATFDMKVGVQEDHPTPPRLSLQRLHSGLVIGSYRILPESFIPQRDESIDDLVGLANFHAFGPQKTSDLVVDLRIRSGNISMSKLVSGPDRPRESRYSFSE